MAVVSVALGAAPASAHATGGVSATNYATVIRWTTPAVPGVEVSAVGVDGQLQLENTSGVDVIVLGYDSEPYLRVGPSGAFENVRSPATYRNRTRIEPGVIPPIADPKAAPEWKRVGSCCRVQWHDHRAHWMGSQPPAAVQADPSTERAVSAGWTVVLVRNGAPITVVGDVMWVPGTSLWPWLVGVVLIAAVVIGLSRTRIWNVVLAVTLGVLLIAEAVHLVGGWLGDLGSGPQWVGVMLSFAAFAFGGFALGYLIRRGGEEAAPSVLIAALALGITGGVSDFDVFTKSQLPTALTPTVARIVVMVVTGCALGLVVAAGMRLKRTAPPVVLPAESRAEPEVAAHHAQ